MLTRAKRDFLQSRSMGLIYILVRHPIIMGNQAYYESFGGKNVAVIGASTKPDRTSYKAVRRLLDKGYNVFGVNPSSSVVHGIKCVQNIYEITENIDFATIYVNPHLSSSMGLAELLIEKGVKGVIFNPDTENPDIAAKLRDYGINVKEECTLIELSLHG